MFDFLLKNIHLSILLLFLVISIILFFIFKNDYIKQKIIWWQYIIVVFLVSFLLPYWELFLIFVIFWFSLYEARQFLVFWIFKNILLFLGLILFLAWLSYFIYQNILEFFYIFILVSFSDIVAYTVWKNFVWKRWFTSLSPNKTLSWFLAQIWFLSICLFFLLDFNLFLSIIVWLLAPVWDLIESFFKRKSWIKDTAEYIPWHWWVLDRIDSTLFWVNFILFFNIIVWFFLI